MNESFTFGSLFAGVGGFDLGFEKAGGRPLWQVEFDKVAQGVLRFRFPGVPLHGDIRKVKADDLELPDVICYGFPCQDISQANQGRQGLKGQRSGLFYEAMRLFREFKRQGSGVRITIAENVGGLLNVDNRGGLARVLRELSEFGTSTGWTTLDSQNFGIPQRRRRVFVVSCSGKERPEQILSFEKGLRRNFEESEKKRERGKLSADSSPGPRGPRGERIFTPGQFGAYKEGVGTLRAQGGDMGGGSENLAVVDLYNQQECEDVASTITSATGICNATGPKVIAYSEEVADPISTREGWNSSNAGNNPKARNLIVQNLRVRRLTPVETCRLQGFPDDWNEWQKTEEGEIKKVSDAQRYKQMGNAVSVPVAEYLGQQISKELNR